MAILVCNGTLVDGTGRDPITRGAVLVEGKQIVAAGPEGQVRAPAGARILDAGGGTLIPGLFNLHDHISRKRLRIPRPGVSFRDQGNQLMGKPLHYLILHSTRNVLDELKSGVTTIVDMGLTGTTALSLRDAINEGLLPGPRLLGAAHPVCITGGHVWHLAREADGPDEVRKAVREQIKAGADCIKFMGSGGLAHFPEEDPDIPEFTLEELQAGVGEARKFHKRAAVHSYAIESTKIGVRAGADSIEHGVYMDEEAIAMMRGAGTDLVPTISGLTHLPYQYKSLGQIGLHDAIMERVIGPQMKSIRRAVEAGLRVGIGTDTAGEVIEEIELLQEASGLSNLDCLRAATRVSAEIARLDRITGTLEPGKRADLVVVDGQPLDRLADLRRPKWVLRDGEVFEGAPMPLSLRVQALAGLINL